MLVKNEDIRFIYEKVQDSAIRLKNLQGLISDEGFSRPEQTSPIVEEAQESLDLPLGLLKSLCEMHDVG